jgi:hypothetical protein
MALTRLIRRILTRAAIRNQRALLQDLEARLAEALLSLPAQRDACRERLAILRNELENLK